MLVDRLAVGLAAGAIDGVDRDGGQAELLRSLHHIGAAERSSSILFWISLTLARARSVAISFFTCAATLS